jgi:amino acid adenylation domain-containing protein
MSNKLLHTHTFQIDNDLSEELKYTAKKQNVGLYAILLAAFQMLLFRRTGQHDISVATPNSTFSDLLLIKNSLNGEETVAALIQRTKDITRQAFLHGQKPFDEAGVVSLKSDIHNPLYQFMFVLQNFAEEELNRDKFEEAVAGFGLTFSVTQTSDHLMCTVIYARHLYNNEMVIQIIGHYNELLHAIGQYEYKKVGELPILTQPEQDLLFKFNNTQVAYPTETTIINLFEQQARQNPDRVAIVFNEDKLTYGQLNEKANQLGRYLKQKGIKQEELVPVCLERSMEMIIAILGIWKAGGAYIPIDPELPESRIKYELTDIAAKVMISDADNLERLRQASPDIEVIALKLNSDITGQFSGSNLINRVLPNQLAYVIYTSGSTGKPKGVMVEHKSIFNYILYSKEKFIKDGENNSGTFVHLSYTFDASLKSMFTPLISGKLIVISSKPLAYVFEDINLHKYAPYDFIQLTPSHLGFFYLVYKDATGKPITGKISIGGEALYLSHFDSLIEAGDKLEVVNEYGPTEATVACSSYVFNTLDNTKTPQRLPIGKPIANTQIYILNEYNQPVPVGVTGELCVGGVQVARGYLNSPDLTKSKFIPDPFNHISGETVYKTGDMGRWLPDGNIECLGRKDDQVKIRGYRVEPGEIESILIKNEAIRQATIITKEDEHKRKYLAAYIVPNGVFNKKEIISYLQTWLPGYMIPERWIIQEQLPLTQNGKIDRSVLPEPEIRSAVQEDTREIFAAPRSIDEQKIAQIWQDVLGVRQIGINDNFFELGEPSLLAVKVLRLVEEMTGKYLPLSTIYENPTIEKFVQRLNETK